MFVRPLGSSAVGWGLVEAESVALRLARQMKHVAMLASTVSTTAKRLKIPQFIPRAIAESDWP